MLSFLNILSTGRRLIATQIYQLPTAQNLKSFPGIMPRINEESIENKLRFHLLHQKLLDLLFKVLLQRTRISCFRDKVFQQCWIKNSKSSFYKWVLWGLCGRIWGKQGPGFS